MSLCCSRSPLPAVGTVISLFLAAAVLAGCAGGAQLRTDAAQARSVPGTYRLLLYGCHHADDLENAAFIVSEQPRHAFRLFASDTSYRTISHLPFDRATELAEQFLRCGMRTVSGIGLRRILLPDGETAAYELRPRYIMYEVGTEEAVQINYSLKDGVITVYIRLAPSLELRTHFHDMPGAAGPN